MRRSPASAWLHLRWRMARPEPGTGDGQRPALPCPTSGGWPRNGGLSTRGVSTRGAGPVTEFPPTSPVYGWPLLQGDQPNDWRDIDEALVAAEQTVGAVQAVAAATGAAVAA